MFLKARDILPRVTNHNALFFESALYFILTLSFFHKPDTFLVAVGTA
jgi:hypothetical protein